MLTTQNHIILQQRAIRADKKQKNYSICRFPSMQCSTRKWSRISRFSASRLTSYFSVCAGPCHLDVVSLSVPKWI